MTTLQTQEAESYWNFIKNSSNEVKLWLINKLSFSLINPSEISIDGDKETEDFINKFGGCWKGNDSAEEIIRMIKENPSCKEPPLF